MTNPVMQALAIAREQEREQERAKVASAVREKLGLPLAQGDKSKWPVWQAWCRAKGIDAFPVIPAVLAIFILEHHALGIGELMRVVESVSAIHANCADPSLSPLVNEALNRVAPTPIEPPRSWDTENRAMWAALPRAIRKYVADRENDRDRALRRKMQPTRKESKNGIHQQDAPAAAGNTDAAIQN